MVDARLPDGSRVNAVVPPLAVDGSLLTIRKFAAEALQVDDLISFGTVPRHVAVFLAACVLGRSNILVSGGTGAGKTTTLNVLSSFIPADERVVTIEDAAELQLHQDHVLRLESRPPNIEGKGEVKIRDLVRNALRMRPDRIVVGECRGAEVRELLAALNTGHAGGCGTVHANASAEVPARLEALGSLAGMSPRALAGQVAAAIDVVVHVERHTGLRRVAEVAVVSGDARAGLSVEPALTRDGDGSAVPGPAWPALAAALRLSPAAIGAAP
jgi:pilus assembly protein CpaF